MSNLCGALEAPQDVGRLKCCDVDQISSQASFRPGGQYWSYHLRSKFTVKIASLKIRLKSKSADTCLFLCGT